MPHLAIVACLALSASCRESPVASPVAAPLSSRALSARSFYVSPDGTPQGKGSRNAPWDLATALRQPYGVFPNDTIWLRAGTYRGDFSSRLTGEAGKPIVLRQYPGERATIDGRIDIAGSHAYYWGFEVMYSDPRRVTQQAGSDPTNLPREIKTIFVTGPFNRLINLIVHDLGDGLFSGSSAEGLEVYGTLLYNNGWLGPDRGHGHSLYLQNLGATKRIVDNVMFNSFSSGLKIGGSSAAFLLNFHVEGNASFLSGSSVRDVHGYSWNMHVEGGGGNLGNAVFDRNSFYHPNGLDQSFRLNVPGDPPGRSLTFSNNIVQGSSVFNEWNGYRVTGNKFTSGRGLLSGQVTLISLRLLAGQSFSAHRWDGNAYAAPAASPKQPFYLLPPPVLHTLATWKAATGYDLISTYIAGAYSGSDVIVRPNVYERGRAFVTCWNWDGVASLPVDLHSVLRTGERYAVHNVVDVFGPPVASGTFDGRPVQLPQLAMPVTPPIGFPTPSESSGPFFNVFLVRLLP